MAHSGSDDALAGFASRPVWHLPIARGAVALLVGVPLAFVQQHDALAGLIAFALFAALTGTVTLVFRHSVPEALRLWPMVSGAAGLGAATLSAVLAFTAPSGIALSWVVAVWALVTALAEGYAWWQARGNEDVRISRLTNDWRSVAVFTLVAAIVFAVLPRNDVVLVGLIGAYAAIIGVYLVIAALSARPSIRKEAETA